MIAGRVPFDADEPLAILTKHVKEPAPELPVDADQPGASAIRSLIGRGLEKDPSRRFGDAAELRAAIAAVRSEIGDSKTLLLSALPLVSPATDATESAAPIDGSDSAQSPGRQLPPVPQPRAVAAAALPSMAGQSPMARIKALGSRHKKPLIAAAAVLVILFAVIAASGGTETASAGVDAGKSPALAVRAPDSFADDAGLQPGGFAAIDPPPLSAERCQTGAASGLDVTVCEYTTTAAASAAEKKARATIGAHTGAAVVSGTMLLVVADRKAVDPTGTAINTLINRFAGAGR
jgi:hypothetical protein